MIQHAPSVMMQEVPPDALTAGVSLDDDSPEERFSQRSVKGDGKIDL